MKADFGLRNAELKRLLQTGETETVEFKEKLNDSFYQTISALANTKGGTIVLGASDKNKITGIEKSGEFLADLTNRIINKLSIYPDINTLDINHQRVLIINVARSSYPVSYEGKYYERVGNTTRLMSHKKLQVFMQARNTWDAIPGEFSPQEIDRETVEEFVQLAIQNKRLSEISAKDSVEIVLRKLGLLVDGKLTNGAILLFGKDPQKYFINLSARIGRLKDDITIIDDKWARGNLFRQFNETMSIIRQDISVRYEIKEIQRKDIWDYPLTAIREAVLNALIHRDYFNIANFIQIKIYDDYIWFHNPGGLPEGITVDQLKSPHNSVFRNPQIAKVFYLAGFIEQYGSGTVRMLEWLKEEGLPEPEYKEEMGGFSVYFYKDIYTEDNLIKMGLKDRQIKAVMYVKERGKITNKEYQKLTKVSKPTATRDFAELVQKNIFILMGKGKRDTNYTLIKPKMSQKGI
ncbi:MAG TPA: helix-turn-helix domain-containing protein [Candidatus Saccharicenans sp.]|jgi:ATP-dependent DNA helicase RecG|nr:putative DNA binding domain-containing protein [Candidatus Saccharicenans sp.]HRD02588.1 helix-turn-helix domain-containing protein [Candidatus Saccharicenans sp.]